MSHLGWVLLTIYLSGLGIGLLVLLPLGAWLGILSEYGDKERLAGGSVFWPIALPLALIFLLFIGMSAGLEALEETGKAYRARKLSQANGQALQDQRLNLPVVAEETENELDRIPIIPDLRNHEVRLR